jgi:hypothetical protein
MANTRYDIELKKYRSIVRIFYFFWSNLKLNSSVLNCRSFNMADIIMNTLSEYAVWIAIEK